MDREALKNCLERARIRAIKANDRKREEEWLMNSIRRHWGEDALEPNFIDVIAESRGWLPLKPGESMTVHFSGEEFVITRKDEP
jgi:hypothetical protein